MEKWMFAFVALLAVAFIFGCTGGEEEQPGVGEGYTLEVSDTSVVGGSVVNLKLTLTNQYEEAMENIEAKLTGFDLTRFTVDQNEQDVGTLESGESFPIVWTITAPEKEKGTETFNPKIQVCFDTKQTYFFDSVLLPKGYAEELPTLTSGYSKGALSITQSGLNEIYTKEGGRTAKGAIELKNIGNGKIKEIYYATIKVPTITGHAADIVGRSLSYSSCEGDCSVDNGETCLIGGEYNGFNNPCDKFKQEIIVQNGLTLTTGITVNDEIEEPVVIRPTGEVSYHYCYEIDVGTITVCGPGEC